MNNKQQSKNLDSRGISIWIAALLLLLTFTVLDAGALAWSASLIGGRQLGAELLTFFAVVAGAAITYLATKAI